MRQKTKNLVDISVSVALYCLTVYVFYESGKFRPSVGNALNSDAWPRLICVFLFIAATVQLINALRGKVVCHITMENKKEVFLVILLLVLYCFLLMPVGFLLCTLVLLISLLWIFKIRSPLPLTILPLATTGVIYLLFSLVLRVPLPNGLLAFILG